MRRDFLSLPVLALAATVGLVGCTDLDLAIGKVPWFGGMRTTVSYGPHEMPRHPAEGTVPSRSPMGELPAAFGPTAAGLDSASMLTNPRPRSEAVVERGRVVYDIQCALCHGSEGEGNGPVVGAGRFPFAPPVATGEAVNRNDGYLYGVVRVGRGLMPAYAERITESDRWAVVHYMRQLQGTDGPLGPAPEADLPLDDADEPTAAAEAPEAAATPGTR
jgi:mono/diheme cytochrome c family protein